MVKCPRCESMVDETVSAICPICQTPVGKEPPVAPMRPQRLPPGARIALTGEIIMPDTTERVVEKGSRPTLPIPVHHEEARVTQAWSRYEQEQVQPNNRKLLLLARLLVAAVVCGALYMGYKFFMNRTDPKGQADRYFAAIRRQDWRTVYETADFDPAQVPSEAAFVERMRSEIDASGGTAIFGRMAANLVITTTPSPHRDADVLIPYSASLNLGPVKIHKAGTVRMHNFGGIWKLTRDNPGVANASPLSVVGLGANRGAISEKMTTHKTGN